MLFGCGTLFVLGMIAEERERVRSERQRIADRAAFQARAALVVFKYEVGEKISSAASGRPGQVTARYAVDCNSHAGCHDHPHEPRAEPRYSVNYGIIDGRSCSYSSVHEFEIEPRREKIPVQPLLPAPRDEPEVVALLEDQRETVSIR
jgi:hypothetical protein